MNIYQFNLSVCVLCSTCPDMCCAGWLEWLWTDQTSALRSGHQGKCLRQKSEDHVMLHFSGFVFLVAGRSDCQLVAGTEELCYSTWQRSWTVNLCCVGEDLFVMWSSNMMTVFALRMKCLPTQRLPWLGRSQAVVEEYLAFLSNLVSAQTVYLRPCLKTLISNFTPSKFYFVDVPP